MNKPLWKIKTISLGKYNNDICFIVFVRDSIIGISYWRKLKTCHSVWAVEQVINAYQNIIVLEEKANNDK